MRMPTAKDHVHGKWDLVVAVRTPDGGTIEFATTRSLDAKDERVRAVRRALALCLGVEPPAGSEP